MGRTEKASASKEASKHASVAPALHSRGIGQNSPNLLSEACGRLPETFAQVKQFKDNATKYKLSVCKLLTHWECDEIKSEINHSLYYYSDISHS